MTHPILWLHASGSTAQTASFVIDPGELLQSIKLLYTPFQTTTHRLLHATHSPGTYCSILLLLRVSLQHENSNTQPLKRTLPSHLPILMPTPAASHECQFLLTPWHPTVLCCPSKLHNRAILFLFQYIFQPSFLYWHGPLHAHCQKSLVPSVLTDQSAENPF